MKVDTFEFSTCSLGLLASTVSHIQKGIFSNPSPTPKKCWEKFCSVLGRVPYIHHNTMMKLNPLGRNLASSISPSHSSKKL